MRIRNVWVATTQLPFEDVSQYLLWKMVMLGCYVSFNECIPGCPSYIHTIQFTFLLLMATSPCHKDILMFSSFNLMLWSVLMRYMKINMEQNDAGLLQMVVLCKTGDVSRFLAVNFFVRGCIMKASRGYISRLRKQPRAKVDHPRDSVVSLNLNESRDPWDKSGTFTYMNGMILW